MHNPSYLIKSRHDIFYFRYPVVTNKGKHRISLSLRTRCPNEALRYSKTLEYHGYNLLLTMDTCSMKHSEVMALLKGYFKKALDKAKNRIDREGCLPQKNIDNIKNALEQTEYLIQNDHDCIEEQWLDTPHQGNALFHDLQKVMQEMNVNFDIDSQEYQYLKNSYKHARRNHFQDVLAYNSSVYNYSLIKTPYSSSSDADNDVIKCSLDEIVNKYLNETKGTITDRSLEAQKSSLKYLVEYFGGEKIVSDISSKDVQNIKEMLQVTPKNRNKLSSTRGKPLLEQVKIAQESCLEYISITTANKHLSYFSTFLKWSECNKYIRRNPFENVQIKQNKKNKQRDLLRKEEVIVILKELESNSLGLVKNESLYWGTMLGIYTGARKNEIASLTVDDVKKHNDIWYIEITDEGEGKRLKTKSSKRIVPVHSRLLELGFLDFLEHSQQYLHHTPTTSNMQTRLLYDFNYTSSQWGRKLGRFFNNRLLTQLNLKTDKKVFHSLRHSFITYLEAEKVENATIYALAGHEHETVTHSTYTHYGLDHLEQFKEAIERLNY